MRDNFSLRMKIPTKKDISGLIEDMDVARAAPIISIDEKKVIAPIPQETIPPKPSANTSLLVT